MQLREVTAAHLAGELGADRDVCQIFIDCLMPYAADQQCEITHSRNHHDATVRTRGCVVKLMCFEDFTAVIGHRSGEPYASLFGLTPVTTITDEEEVERYAKIFPQLRRVAGTCLEVELMTALSLLPRQEPAVTPAPARPPWWRRVWLRVTTPKWKRRAKELIEEATEAFPDLD